MRRTLHYIHDFHKYDVTDKMNLPFKSQFTFSLPSEGLCNCIACVNNFFLFTLQRVLLMLNLSLMVNNCAVYRLFFSETNQKVVLHGIIIFCFRTHFLGFSRLLLG